MNHNSDILAFKDVTRADSPYLDTWLTDGGTVTKLSKLANEYITGRIRRGELGRESAKMPRYALRSLCVSFGDRPVNHLNAEAIERWLETIAHKAPATRRNELGAVRGFCGWLVKHRHLRRNPCDDVAKIRQPRHVVHIVQRDEVGALWDACETERDRAIVALMYVLGLRCVDTSRINVEDIDWRNRALLVTGKGGHERVVPLVPQVERALREWIAVDPRTTGALFPSWNGRLKPATISGRVSELLYRAGVKQHPHDGRSAHALRRTAATETRDASGDLRAVQNLLGHADLSSLRHYVARADVGRVAKAVEARWDPGDAA